MEKEKFIKIERVPHDANKNYDEDFVKERRDWIGNRTKSSLFHIAHYSIKAADVKGNIENFIGVCQVPLGILGPLKVNGKYANDIFYVPFATTEGAVLTTYQRGAIAITKSGGAKTSIRKDENHLDPVFMLRDLDDAENFVKWTTDNFDLLSKKVEEVTGHGRLLAITPYIIGKMVALRVSYYTQDAMGANMIGIATDQVCKFISTQYKIERYLLRSNLSSEKRLQELIC